MFLLEVAVGCLLRRDVFRRFVDREYVHVPGDARHCSHVSNSQDMSTPQQKQVVVFVSPSFSGILLIRGSPRRAQATVHDRGNGGKEN